MSEGRTQDQGEGVKRPASEKGKAPGVAGNVLCRCRAGFFGLDCHGEVWGPKVTVGIETLWRRTSENKEMVTMPNRTKEATPSDTRAGSVIGPAVIIKFQLNPGNEELGVTSITGCRQTDRKDSSGQRQVVV